MNMNNVNEESVGEETQGVIDAQESERKMMELMSQMQKEASTVPTIQQDNKNENISITVKTEDPNTNYWDVDVIPTGYKLYPDGTEIKARPLKVIEVKKLTSINDVNADKVVNDILRKSVTGIDINDLYSADKMYLLLWLRANSFRDNRYVVDFTCDCCDKDSTYHFDIDNVNVDFLDDSFSDNLALTLSTDEKLTFKLLQIKDEVALTTFNNKYRSLFEKSGEEVDDELLAISFMIDTVNGSKLDSVQMYNYILDMSAGDFAAVTTTLGNINVGIKNYMSVKCDDCGGTSQLGITFHPDFFLPKYKSE